MASAFLPQLPKIHIPQKMTSFYRPRRSISEHQAAISRKMSMSLVNKGLLNPTGENNCFLNSAVQVLWHIDVFRRSFREFKGHTCIGEACIFCSLKSLFNDIQYSELAAIPPDNLRQSMASCYKEQQRFQLGLMDDAAECFEKLLEQIHYHLTGNEDMDICGASFCLSHQKFALTILERTECVCGATSEPLSFVQFVHYISSAAIVKEAQKLEDAKQQATPITTPTDDPVAPPTPHHVTSSSFGRVLNAASAFGEFRECPNYRNCKKTVSVKRILMNAPDVVCLGLIWDSDQPPVTDIMAVVNNIGLTLRLNEVFDQVISDGARINEYHLTALIAYYGRHYSTFCYHGALKEWTYFDDAKFRTIGKDWSDVCEEIRKAHYQPLLLVYANPFADVLDVSEAPKKVTVVNTGNHDNQPKHTVIAEESKSEESTNQIQDVNSDVTANQIKPPRSDDKPVTMATEAIDPMTFSIIPSSLQKQSTNQIAGSKQSSTKTPTGTAQEKTTPTENKATPTVTEDHHWVAQFNEPVTMATHTQPPSTETATPAPDLMTFSISPVAIATAQRNATPTKLPIHHQPAVSQSRSSSEQQDLIEFSLFPNSFYKKLSASSPTMTVASSGVQALPNKSSLPVSDSHSSRSNSNTSELELIWEHFSEPNTPTTPPQDPLPKILPRPPQTTADSWAVVSMGGTTRNMSPDPPGGTASNATTTSPAVRQLKRVSSYHGSERNKTLSSNNSVATSHTSAVPTTMTSSSSSVMRNTSKVANTNSKPAHSTLTGKRSGQPPPGNRSYTSSHSRPSSTAAIASSSSVTTRPWRVVQDPNRRGQNKSPSPNYAEIAQGPITTHRRNVKEGRGQPDPLYADPDEVLDKKSGRGNLVYAELDFPSKMPHQQKVSQASTATHSSHMTNHMTSSGPKRPLASTASEQSRKNPPIGLDPLYAVPEQVRRRLAAQKGQQGSLSNNSATSQRDVVSSRELSTQTLQSSATPISSQNQWMVTGKLGPPQNTAMSQDRSHGNKIPGQSHDQASRVPIGQDPLYAVPDKVKARQQAAQRLNTSHTLNSGASHDSHVIRSKLSAIPSSVIMALSDTSQTFLLRARDLWAKAEASLDSDSTVALMLFTQANNLLSKLVQADDVIERSSLLQLLKDTREEGLKMCDILKPSQLTTTGNHGNDQLTRSSSFQGSCKRCGRTRSLDTQLLCGPCKLRVQMGQK